MFDGMTCDVILCMDYSGFPAHTAKDFFYLFFFMELCGIIRFALVFMKYFSFDLYRLGQ